LRIEIAALVRNSLPTGDFCTGSGAAA